MVNWLPQYQLCQSEWVWWVDDGTGTFDMQGADRVRMLQGFCTADIEKLPENHSTEAFILSPKGKTLALLRVFKLADRLWLHCDSRDIDPLVQHLDRYVIREDVEFMVRTEQRSEFVVVGPHAGEQISKIFGRALPSSDDDVECDEWQGHALRITKSSEFGILALRIDVDQDGAELLADSLGENHRVTQEVGDALRIEQGTPRSGFEVTEDNLPQELQRDSTAISFTKGCYLGQETVARIDALGHVNRLLVGLKFEDGAQPEAGLELNQGDQKVGKVTSTTYSPHHKCMLALGFLRRGIHQAGTVVQSSQGDATVIAFD